MRRTPWAALAVYVALSAVFFGTRLAFQAGPAALGGGADVGIFIWSFAWWPHAIFHWQDPFITHAIWAPDGTNLAWTASTPGLALLFMPLTSIAGPLVAFDVAAILMPALAAWTAYLLCRHVTRAFWPSLAGGYVFGFSSYMLGAMEGHLHLTSVFLVPLVALVVLRYVEGELDRRGAGWRLGALFGAQLWLSSEVDFTLTLALLVSLVLGLLLVPAARARIRGIVPALAGAAAIAILIAAPILYYLFSDFHSEAINPGAPAFADLVNFVVPTNLVALGHGWAPRVSRHFFSNRSEQAAYIGMPALVILGWFAVRTWRSASSRFLIAAIAFAIFISFGSWLVFLGHNLVPLPWEHVGYLPMFRNVYTARLAMYVSLGLAVVVALWASSRDIALPVRATIVVLALLTMAPDPSVNAWRSTVNVPAFITARLYERCLRPSDNVLPFPFGPQGYSMIWQADAGFRFRMAGGWIAPMPPLSFQHPAGVGDIAIYHAVPGLQAWPVRQYVRLKHVTVILLDPSVPDLLPWQKVLVKIRKPVSIGGMLVYRVRGSPPGRCV